MAKGFEAIRAGIVAALAALASLCASPSQAQSCRADPYAGIDWHGCNKRSLMLDGSDFVKANLVATDFSYTDLRRSVLSAADLTKAKLVRTLLNDAVAERAVFDRVEAYRGSFQNIRANGASFRAGELQRANFSGASLNGASFEKADLSRALFDKAAITGANFAYANLARADLTSAAFNGALDFKSAFFLFTRIEGVDLSRASGLTQQQLDMSCGSDTTKLPDGLTRPAQWPCPPDKD